jgi:hypothetical protein
MLTRAIAYAPRPEPSTTEDVEWSLLKVCSVS